MTRAVRGTMLFFGFWVSVAAAPGMASACGGRTATIAEDPKALGGRPIPWHRGITYYEDGRGGVILPASAVKISSALAEAIVLRYLRKTYGQYEHLEFEAFTFEHGSFVYMFHADVPNLAASYHVGPMQFVTRHAHIHVDGITGDVYGFGCGAGPGIVDMRFDAAAYPPALAGRRLPYLQFDTDFVARNATPPKVDGIIGAEEWRDAAYRDVLVGTRAARITEYG